MDILARYYALCDQRDAVNLANTVLQTQLDAKNAQIIVLQEEALAIRAQIDGNRGGGEAWLSLKKELAMLARALGKIPPRPVA